MKVQWQVIAGPNLLPNAKQMAETYSNLCKAGFQAAKRFILAKTMWNRHNQRL